MTAPEIQREIERTREQLGQTVEELAAKAGVTARARDRAVAVKTEVQARTAEASGWAQAKAAELSDQVRRSPVVRRHWPLAVIAGAVAVGSVAVWRWRRT
jgi:Protein of unknown function (DUF3618)